MLVFTLIQINHQWFLRNVMAILGEFQYVLVEENMVSSEKDML